MRALGAKEEEDKDEGTGGIQKEKATMNKFDDRISDRRNRRIKNVYLANLSFVLRTNYGV